MSVFTVDKRPAFGAKYEAEDYASYILHGFDRYALDGRAVSMERFARFLSIDVYCEHIVGDCSEILGVAAFEPQRVYTLCGALDLKRPAAIAERDIIDRGESGLYNFALGLLCSEYLMYLAKNGETDTSQLSFGLDTVASKRLEFVSLEKAFDDIGEDGDSPSCFALKLLMPKNGFKRQTVELYAELGVNRATVDGEKHLPFVLSQLSARYNVPEIAVLLRLKDLNLY